MSLVCQTNRMPAARLFQVIDCFAGLRPLILNQGDGRRADQSAQQNQGEGQGKPPVFRHPHDQAADDRAGDRGDIEHGTAPGNRIGEQFGGDELGQHGWPGRVAQGVRQPIDPRPSNMKIHDRDIGPLNSTTASSPADDRMPSE